MVTYRVWLTVKDNYGNIKEVDGGTINVDLADMSSEELGQMVNKLDTYLATDAEVEYTVDNKDTIKYSAFDLRPEE